jgi:hypothetical protein
MPELAPSDRMKSPKTRAGSGSPAPQCLVMRRRKQRIHPDFSLGDPGRSCQQIVIFKDRSLVGLGPSRQEFIERPQTGRENQAP